MVVVVSDFAPARATKFFVFSLSLAASDFSLFFLRQCVGGFPNGRWLENSGGSQGAENFEFSDLERKSVKSDEVAAKRGF